VKAVVGRWVYNQSFYHDLDGTDWNPNEQKINLTICLTLFSRFLICGPFNTFFQTYFALNFSAT